MAQTKTSFQGKIRSYGGTNKGDASPGVAVLSVMFSFNPVTAANTDGTTNVKIGSSATTGEDFVLPKGAVPISITTKAVATGGTNPTVDIGCLAHSDGAGGTTAADPDGLFNELDADANNTQTIAAGALVTTAGLTANATVTGNVGSSAATGGTYTGVLTYYCVDDGKETYPQLT